MPRVKLSRKAHIILYFMRFYIVLMFLLVVLNFIQTFRRHSAQPPPAPQQVEQKEGVPHGE